MDDWSQWRTFKRLPRDGEMDDQYIDWIQAVQIVENSFRLVERELEEEARQRAAQQNRQRLN